MQPEKKLVIEELVIHQIKNQVEELLNVSSVLEEAIRRKTLIGNSRHERMILSLDKMIISLAESITKLTDSTGHFTDLGKTGDDQSHPLLDAVRQATDLVAASINLCGIKIEGEDKIPTGLTIGIPFFLSTFVIANLINNAKDAIRDGDTSNGLISIEVEEKLEEILLHIADNGPGVSEKVSDILFVKPVISAKLYGSGEGLYLSNRELKKNQGYVELVSLREPTKFTIHFPKSSKERQ